jgi:hypothetical protein
MEKIYTGTVTGKVLLGYGLTRPSDAQVMMNEFYHEFGLFGHPDMPDELGIYAGHVRDR